MRAVTSWAALRALKTPMVMNRMVAKQQRTPGVTRMETTTVMVAAMVDPEQRAEVPMADVVRLPLALSSRSWASCATADAASQPAQLVVTSYSYVA